MDLSEIKKSFFSNMGFEQIEFEQRDAKKSWMMITSYVSRQSFAPNYEDVEHVIRRLNKEKENSRSEREMEK